MASIRRLGFNTPVAVDAQGVIIAGHARVLAALEMGLPRIPTICLSHLSEQQIREFMPMMPATFTPAVSDALWSGRRFSHV